MPGYKLSCKAENDLKDIYKYTYHQHGEKQADKYIDALQKKFQSLSKNPLLCRKRKEFNPPVRIHRHKKHLIIYTREQKNILIVRILHERMNLDNHL